MKIFHKLLSIGISLLYASFIKANAQSTTITPGNSQPNITATSTDNGIVVPKITLTASLSSASPVSSPTEGLLVYNIGGNQPKGFYFWTGTAWKPLDTSTSFSATAPISIVSNNIKLNAGTAVGQLLTWDGNNWVNTNPKPATNITNLQPYLVINFCISLEGGFPTRNGYEPFLGEISMYSFNFAPRGWAACDGQLLSISQNTPLYALLGTEFGGDGLSTFALPDLRGRVPVHRGQGPGLSSNYILGQKGGFEYYIIQDKY